MTTPINYSFSSRIFIITDDVDIQKQFLPPIEFDDDCIVTKYLTSEQKDSIRSQQVTREEVDHFVYHFNSKNSLQHMVDNLKENEKNGMLALRSWHEKLISDDQFFTACYVYSALDQMYIDRRRYELRFNPSNLTVTHHELSLKPEFFNEGLSDLPVTVHSIYDGDNKNDFLKKYFAATELLILIFQETLRNAPESEKCFLVIDLPLAPVSSWSPLYGRLESSSPFLHRVELFDAEVNLPYPGIEPPKVLLVPSFSIYKTWFTCINPSFKFQPVLGKISKQMIMEHIDYSQRVGNLSCPGALVPLKADKNMGGRYIFCLHDIYHMSRLLLTPQSHLRGMIKICQILLNLKLSQTHNDTLIETIRWKIMDGENFGYKNNIVERFGGIFNTTKPWTEEIKEGVLHSMAVNKSEWKQETTLSIKEHLYPEELEIYRRLRQKIKEDKLL